MSEYVEKQALDDAFASLIPWAIGNEIDAAYEQGLCAAHNALLGFPVADVAPVVHEHWIKVQFADSKALINNGNLCLTGGFLCGSCGHSVYEKSPYCPNCGAKMDVETP